MDFLDIVEKSDNEWAEQFKININLPCKHNTNIPQWILENESILQLYQSTLTEYNIGSEVIVMLKKIIVDANDMSYKQREIYNSLILEDNLEADIHWMNTQSINDLIGAPDGQRVSGRVVDSLMTKYPKFSDVHYYIDVTNADDTIYIERDDYVKYMDENPSAKLLLFNISSAYRSYMNLYSKTFFDPFSRGVEVIYKLSNGEYVTFSMCKLIFYRWCRKYHVFDFLKKNYANILHIQKEDQRRQRELRLLKRKQKDRNIPKTEYKPKRKYKCIKATICPRDNIKPITNNKTYRVIPKKK